MNDWGLHLKAHRTGAFVAVVVAMHLVAHLLFGASTTLMGLMGPQPTPTVSLPTLVVAPAVSWWLACRTQLELVSTRPLVASQLIFVWLVTIVPAIPATLLTAGGAIYLRALLGAVALTVLTWCVTSSRLSALPAVVWFIWSTLTVRLIGRGEYWAFFTMGTDPRSWALPCALTCLALIVTVRRALV